MKKMKDSKKDIQALLSLIICFLGTLLFDLSELKMTGAFLFVLGIIFAVFDELDD